MDNIQLNIKALKEGDKKELWKLYEYLLPRIEAYLKRVNVREIEVIDIVHDTILSLYSKFDRIYSQFKNDTDKDGNILMSRIANYSFAIARNLTYDKLRYTREKTQLEQCYSEEITIPPVEEFIVKLEEQTEYTELIENALETLSPVEKKIFILKFNGNTYSEIAEILNISNGDVRIAGYRAMKQMRNKITKRINR